MLNIIVKGEFGSGKTQVVHDVCSKLQRDKELIELHQSNTM